MPNLFTYCIPVDDGAAPNPFGEVCTLVICKPVIRRIAEKGDWIVATGSTQYGFENKVVYAMEVTQKITMKEYDEYCKKELTVKIPNMRGKNYEEKVGDCIYDLSTETPKIRNGVHNEDNKPRDLGGKSALLSDNFYYFGNKPILLPNNLLGIVRQGQGHKSISNKIYYEDFINWIETLKQFKNKINADPFLKDKLLKDCNFEDICSIPRKLEHDEYERLIEE